MILVTGGTGFIGRNVLKMLTDAGYKVRTLLRPSRATPALPRGIALDVALSGLNDPRGLRAALLGVDAIIHLASGERFSGLEDNYLPESVGTRNLAEAAAEVGIERMLFLSHLGSDRDSAYALLRSKGESEAYIRNSGLNYTIIRSSLAYGPGDHFTTKLAMMLSLAPGVFPLPGVGKTLLQPIRVEDLATTILWALDEPATSMQRYEIGGPEFLTLREIVELVMHKSGMHRSMIDMPAPYLRWGARILERILREPLVTRHWLDYFANNRMAELNSLPRIFGLQPERMEYSMDYLSGVRWRREFFRFQRAARSGREA
jgi:uncharacterized protein YbjT (DUF2867 family)